MWIFSRGSQSQIGIIACVIQRFSCKPHKWCVIVQMRDNKKQQEKVKRSGWDGGRNIGTTVKPGFTWNLQSLSAAISATLCCLWSLSYCDRWPRWKVNLWPCSSFSCWSISQMRWPPSSPPPPDIHSFPNLSQNKKSISPPHQFHTPAMPVATETTHYSPGDRSFPLAAPFDWPVSQGRGGGELCWLVGWLAEATAPADFL